jgi:uncharacterized protein YcbX
MAHLDRLTVYPVKALDGVDVDAARVLDGGTLAHDREFALFDDSGDVVNGKRTARVHDLDTDFDPESTTLTVEAPDSERREFDLDTPADRDRAAAWFGDFFDLSVTLERDTDLGYVDRRDLGPSVVSTATLETVASWFDDLTVDSVRRRLRANVEVGGVEPFWEDRFVGPDAPAFAVDGVRFEGATPCGRCVVPERDPETGDPLPEFRERFVERRRETFPEFADGAAFDHFYAVMVISSVPEASRGEVLEAGDGVEVVES